MAIAAALVYFNSNKPIPIATVKDTSPSSIAQAQLDAGKFKSIANAKEVSKLIEQRYSKAADVTFYTATQQEADKRANAIAKQTGADYIVKETKAPETKPASGSVTEDSNSNEGIVNNYYAITLEKKNQLLAGVTTIDGSVHFSLGYQRDKVQVLVHSKDLKKISGVGIVYKFKSW